MQAITVSDREAGVAGLSLMELPYPVVSENDVVVLVTIAEPPKTQPRDGRALYFLVEPDRARLADLAARVREGRLKPMVGAVLPLADTAAAFAPDKRTPGKTILRVAED
jgi:Zinc-binding dehydrogenase